MRLHRTPILLVQWGPEDELDELDVIIERFEELAPPLLAPADYHRHVSLRAYLEHVLRRHGGYPSDPVADWKLAENAVRPFIEIPDIVAVRYHNPDARRFLHMLEGLIEAWATPQALYLSCHGTTEHLCFSASGDCVLSFEDFGATLSRLRDSSVHLVLGCCFGLSPDSPILKHLPPQISCVQGFTETPSAFDVAQLMLGTQLDDAELFGKLSSFSQATTVGGISFDKFAEVVEEMERRAEEHMSQERPARLVEGRHGVGVRTLRRVEYDHGWSWQGSTEWL